MKVEARTFVAETDEPSRFILEVQKVCRKYCKEFAITRRHGEEKKREGE